MENRTPKKVKEATEQNDSAGTSSTIDWIGCLLHPDTHAWRLVFYSYSLSIKRVRPPFTRENMTLSRHIVDYDSLETKRGIQVSLSKAHLYLD